MEQLWSYLCLPNLSALSMLNFKIGTFFCQTLNTLSVAGRIKKIIKIKKHEIFEKSGMEGILMHGEWSLKN